MRGPVQRYKHVIWIPGIANLVEHVNQGVLVVFKPHHENALIGVECNVEVDHGVGRRRTQALPILQDRIPCVLHMHVVPTLCEGRREAAGGEDKKQRERAIAHGYRRSPRWFLRYNEFTWTFRAKEARSPECPKG